MRFTILAAKLFVLEAWNWAQARLFPRWRYRRVVKRFVKEGHGQWPEIRAAMIRAGRTEVHWRRDVQAEQKKALSRRKQETT